MRFVIVGVSLVAGWLGAGGNTWAGSLLVRDGKTYSGKVEFKAGNQVSVIPASGAAVTVPLEDLVRLTMAEASTEKPRERDPRLPLPWQQADIGRVKESGSGTEEKGVFTVRGAGWGLWGAADSFHFVYQPCEGDVDVVAHMGEPPSEKNPLVAGLTIRESLEPSSKQAAVMVFPKGEVRMSCRPLSGPGQSAPPAGDKPYPWVRLIRVGNLFSGFCSLDGQNWRPVGTLQVKMGPTGYAGLACAATLNEAAVGTTFDHVAVTAQPPGPQEGFGLVDGSVIAGTVQQLDEQSFAFNDGAGNKRSLSAQTVAYIFTRPLPPDMRKALGKRTQGIALANGDELEGSVQGLKEGRVTLDSVLFGRKAEPVSKVLLVALRAPQPGGGFSVCTRDGSLYRCTSIKVAEGELIAEGGVSGPVTVKVGDVVEVRRGEP